MHGSRGQNRAAASKQTYGQSLLLSVACPDIDTAAPYAYSNESFLPLPSHQPASSHRKPPPTSSRSNSPFSAQPTKPIREFSRSWKEIGGGRGPRPRCVDEESLFSLNFPSSHHGRSHKGSGNRTTSSPTPPGRRKFIYRCFQIFSILIVGISVYALVENIKYLIRTYDGDVDELSQGIGNRFVNINEELQSWVVIKRESDLFSTTSSDNNPKSTTVQSVEMPKSFEKFVLNINSIPFDINNDSVCKSTPENHPHLGGDDAGIYFMIIIHSAPAHFEARQAIRTTWGSLKSLKNVAFKLVFLMGKTSQEDEEAGLVESSILRESQIFGDIVTGSFIDSYKNLTYKHLLGYKWAVSFCPDSAFILKADDDAFIDIFQLFDFISRTYGIKPMPGTLICNVFPEGSKPVRASDTQGKKWTVDLSEYPFSMYPKYCGGLAYLITPDVVKRILDLSDKVKFLWIDDVFVLGILRELAGVEPFYLNLRYSYEPDRYRKWLLNYKENNGSDHSTTTSDINDFHNNLRSSKLPFMITHVERGPKFSEEMNQLWRKTKQAWGRQ